MADIAFFNFPAIGHVNPTLGVVEELVRRGHRVTCTATDYFASAIEAAGAEPVRYASNFGDFYRSPYSKETMAGEGMRCLNEATTLYEQVSSHYQAKQPDVIVHDFMAWGARFYAAKHDIPAVRLFPSYGVSETFNINAKFPIADMDDPQIAEMAQKLATLLPEFGLSPDVGAFMGHVEESGVIFMPRDFHYDGDSFDERFVFAGPCLGDRKAFQGTWERPSDAERVLLVSLGTAATGWPEFFPMVIEAFKDSDWHVVVAAGDHISPSELGELPANVDVRRHVPQLEVLAHADVFLTHAGMNSTMEALHTGVPMVAIPQMNEQRANALRVEELGFGSHLAKEETDTGKLREAVDAVAGDQALSDRVRAMGERMRQVDGRALAADAIEKRLSETS